MTHEEILSTYYFIIRYYVQFVKNRKTQKSVL